MRTKARTNNNFARTFRVFSEIFPPYAGSGETHSSAAQATGTRRGRHSGKKSRRAQNRHQREKKHTHTIRPTANRRRNVFFLSRAPQNAAAAGGVDESSSMKAILYIAVSRLYCLESKNISTKQPWIILAKYFRTYCTQPAVSGTIYSHVCLSVCRPGE